MKVLFIFPDAPLSENFSGQASRFSSVYQALLELRCDVYVWRPLSESGKVFAYESEMSVETAAVRSRSKFWRDVEYEKKIIEIPQLPDLLKWVYRRIYFLIHPLDFCFPGSHNLKKALKSILEEVKPDLLWVETPFLGAAVYQSTNIPWVYQNHDFLYKLRLIRLATQKQYPSLGFILTNSFFKYLEYKIASASSIVVTGSVSEAIDIKKHGQPNVVVIPTTYKSVPTPSIILEENPSIIRINHLGALTTTANYSGLKAYFEIVHPKLIDLLRSHNLQVELFLVGDPANAKRDLLELISENHAEILGFQPNLENILRPFDISIIPYDQNTGTRTKVPLLMNHAQVIVATKNAVAGTPEVLQCNGCFFVNQVGNFLDPILQLALDAALRKKMGLLAKDFFEKYFTLNAQLDDYKAILTSFRAGDRN